MEIKQLVAKWQVFQRRNQNRNKNTPGTRWKLKQNTAKPLVHIKISFEREISRFVQTTKVKSRRDQQHKETHNRWRDWNNIKKSFPWKDSRPRWVHSRMLPDVYNTFLKLLHVVWWRGGRGSLPNSFYKASISLVPLSLMTIEAKNLQNTIKPNICLPYIFIYITYNEVLRFA